MNELSTFTSGTFGDLRTVSIDNEPWFVGKDVAEKLGYTNSRKALADHVDKEDKKILKPVDFPQRSRNVTFGKPIDFPQKYQNGTFEIPPRGMTVINESGLYSLILASKLPQAKQFKYWVTSEVLPAIRSKGMYATPEAVSTFLSNPDAMVELLRQVSDERDHYLAQRTELQDTQRKLQAAQEELKHTQTQPFLMREGESEHLVDQTQTIAALARTASRPRRPVTRKEAFDLLRKFGYIRPDSPLPTLKAVQENRIIIVEHRSASGSRYYTAGVTVLGMMTLPDDIQKYIDAKEGDYRCRP